MPAIVNAQKVIVAKAKFKLILAVTVLPPCIKSLPLEFLQLNN